MLYIISIVKKEKMMNRIMRTFIFLLFTLNLFSIDQTSDINKVKLDLNTAVSKALKNNLTLKNNEIDFKNKVLNLATTWNNFLPDAGLSASMGSNIDSGKNSLSVGFSTSLSINGKSILNVYQSVLDYQSGKVSLEQAKSKLICDVKKYYYNVVLLKEQIDLKQKEIDVSKLNFEVSLQKYQKGMLNEIDKLKSEYTYKSLIPSYKSILNEYTVAMFNLKLLIGIGDTDDIELSDSIPDISGLDYSSILSMSLNDNFDVKILNQTIKSSENSRNTYIAALFPSFNLSYSLSSGFDKDFTKDNWFDDSNNWNNSGSVGFSLSLSLDSYFPFSSSQLGIIEGQNTVLKNKNTLEKTILETRNSIRGYILTLKQIEESMEAFKTNIELAERTYSLTNELYQGGLKSYIELADAQNDLYDSKLELLKSKYNYIVSYLDLKYLLNTENF